jgi:hypothetical protein
MTNGGEQIKFSFHCLAQLGSGIFSLKLNQKISEKKENPQSIYSQPKLWIMGFQNLGKEG